MNDGCGDHEVTVRVGNHDDIDRIAVFNVAMAHETENLTLDIDRVRNGVTNLIEHPERGYYTVAVSGGRLVGCCPRHIGVERLAERYVLVDTECLCNPRVSSERCIHRPVWSHKGSGRKGRHGLWVQALRRT